MSKGAQKYEQLAPLEFNAIQGEKDQAEQVKEMLGAKVASNEEVKRLQLEARKKRKKG